MAQQLMSSSHTPARSWKEQTNTWLFSALLILGGSLFVALCAKIRVPLPFTPVPITAQTLGILLVGSLLGWRLGLLSMGLYLAMGVAGLPFFTGEGAGWSYLLGATGGYLLATPLAAALVGWLAERGWDRRVPTMALSMIFGNAIIYLLGVAWLAALIGLQAAVVKGMLPFIVGDAFKIAIACVVLPGGWRLLGTKKPEQSG
ncbi:MAG: biotin transporter BioY [Chloroflexaceae bacterium]|nr:biotin transporter BioY [Chloroflexaceae bacterium]